MKDAHRIVQTFPLVSLISDCMKQFSLTFHERSFRVIYTSRQLVQIRFADRSLVHISPRLAFQSSANSSIHEFISHNTNGAPAPQGSLSQRCCIPMVGTGFWRSDSQQIVVLMRLGSQEGNGTAKYSEIYRQIHKKALPLGPQREMLYRLMFTVRR
jgi:hypothetical protein